MTEPFYDSNGAGPDSRCGHRGAGEQLGEAVGAPVAALGGVGGHDDQFERVAVGRSAAKFVDSTLDPAHWANPIPNAHVTIAPLDPAPAPPSPVLIVPAIAVMQPGDRLIVDTGDTPVDPDTLAEMIGMLDECIPGRFLVFGGGVKVTVAPPDEAAGLPPTPERLRPV